MLNVSLAVAKLLLWSWRDIFYDYGKLTEEEQNCVTRDEFDALRREAYRVVSEQDKSWLDWAFTQAEHHEDAQR